MLIPATTPTSRALAIITAAMLIGCSDAPRPTSDLSRCLDVTQDMIDTLSESLNLSGSFIQPETIAAVRSRDYEELYFIGGEIEGATMNGPGHVGLWATGSLVAGEAMIFANNYGAVEFSAFPDGAKTKARISEVHDGGDLAIACVQARQKVLAAQK